MTFSCNQMHALYEQAWQSVDPSVRYRAVRALKAAFPDDLVAQIRSHISLHGRHDWIHQQPFDHMFWGMAVRNELRRAGIKDAELPAFDAYYGPGTNVRNWDDYYVSAIEEAVSE